MPRVSKVKTWFAHEEFERIITVNGEGEFKCVLPEFAAGVLGYGVVTDSTKEAVERKVKKASDDYLNSKATKRKVIIYSIKRSAHIMTGTKENDDWKCILNLGQVSFTEGIALDFYAGVYEETLFKSARAEKEHFEYELLPSSLPFSIEPCKCGFLVSGYRAPNQVDWTPEREAFFMQLGLGIEKIMLAFNKIENQSTLLALADATEPQKLLTMP